ncbi:MAG: hypothetical protein BGO96_15845 [Micrococcales bacterium 73-15]|uniref:prepilin peptidase n=1 Tax=Salana multivorans TaxID=120377 RepID=UPI000961986C|nr:prepilin peptidase [Salana multivorans]OJX94368.1 MAG: hypothetical protein BGO96_15845 [Micrococcales bacterium 73-15]
MESLGAVVMGTLAAGAVLVVGAVLTAAVLAPRVASLAGEGARRWWLARPVQALAVLAVTLLALPRTAPALWPGLVVGLAAATLACLVDAASHRLPDVLTVRAGGAALVLAGVGAFYVAGWAGLAALASGAVVAGGVLGLLVLLYPPGMGLGDVKLATLLGGLLGAVASVGAGFAGTLGSGEHLGAVVGRAAAASGGMLAAAFILGGLTSLALLALRRVGRRDAVPFGPFLLLGALVSLATRLL